MSAISSSIKRIKRRNIDPLFHLFGIEVKEFSSELDYFMISEKFTKKSIAMITKKLGEFLQQASCTVATEELEEATAAFYALSRSCPIRQSTGGSGFNAGLELFIMARFLHPSLIIESGVYRGFTTWVLRHAAPRAKILSFDIDLSRVRHPEAEVEYVERDVSAYDFSSLSADNTLCFFDDHVSQALRIEQALSWGFTHLIFDDNLPVHALHGEGLPPFPTVDMIFSDELVEGEQIEWKGEDKFQYTVRKADLFALRHKIAFAQRLPDLSWETGYRASNLTYVKLRPLGGALPLSDFPRQNHHSSS
jgi:hypothetical protein